MSWWLYVLIGLVGGLIFGFGIDRILNNPTESGELIIAEDPDNPSENYLFLRATVEPNEMKQHPIVFFKIVDKTRK